MQRPSENNDSQAIAAHVDGGWKLITDQDNISDAPFFRLVDGERHCFLSCHRHGDSFGASLLSQFHELGKVLNWISTSLCARLYIHKQATVKRRVIQLPQSAG